MDRICSQCNESKVKEDFLRTAGGDRHPYCNKCRKAYINNKVKIYSIGNPGDLTYPYKNIGSNTDTINKIV